MSYASNIDELRNLWRKRLKLSTLDAFASKKEINEDKIDQEENQLKSDEEIEKVVSHWRNHQINNPVKKIDLD